MKHSYATRGSIDTFRFQPDQWLWCLHCERFFQGRDARPDGIGSVQACGFAECGAAGYQVDIFDWDAWVSDNPRLRASWPKLDELRRGLVASLDDGREPFPTAENMLRDPHAYGVGAALNQDVARRDAILGTSLETEQTEHGRFDDLDLTRLERLVQEGFVLPDAPMPFYPNASRVMAFMREWPQIRASGYIMGPSRPDYGLWIDTLECEAETVPLEVRDRLAEELERLFEDATDAGEIGDVFGAWWY